MMAVHTSLKLANPPSQQSELTSRQWFPARVKKIHFLKIVITLRLSSLSVLNYFFTIHDWNIYGFFLNKCT